MGSDMDSLPTTNATAGAPESIKNRTLETGAGLIQQFHPVKRICAHLNAFHVYANEPTRCVQTHHYCAHLNEDVRQCILYDSDKPGARIIGTEYMIKPHLYETLDAEERALWHSHVFEVKSGMLVMPAPSGVPDAVWETAENAEMEEVIVLYGKVFHLWQVDRGDKLPLGKPELMTSFTEWSQLDHSMIAERDKELGVDSKKKAKARKHIEEPHIHPDADAAWKQTR